MGILNQNDLARKRLLYIAGEVACEVQAWPGYWISMDSKSIHSREGTNHSGDGAGPNLQKPIPFLSLVGTPEVGKQVY